MIFKLATYISSTGGPAGVRMHLLKDAYAVFTRHPKSQGLVALAENDRVVGYHFRRPLTILINDVPLRGMLGFNMAVHPDFRRQGIGAKIYQAVHKNCIDKGIDLFFGNTEQRNFPQRGNLKKFSMTEVKSQIRAMVTTRRFRPSMPAGINIMRINGSDFGNWCESANEFYSHHNFWQPIRVDLLKAWSSPTCEGCKHSLYAAKNSNGQLLAGLGIDDCSRLFTWVMNGVALPARIVGHLLKVTDGEGHVPFAKVILLWYRKGRQDAARLLWEWIRWDLRQNVRLIVAYYDPLSPLREVVRPSFYLPKTQSIRAVRFFSDFKIKNDRPIGTEFI